MRFITNSILIIEFGFHDAVMRQLSKFCKNM